MVWNSWLVKVEASEEEAESESGGASSYLLSLALAVVVMGLLMGMFYAHQQLQMPKEAEHQSSPPPPSSPRREPVVARMHSHKELSISTPAKLKSAIRAVTTTPSAYSVMSAGIQSESINTVYNLDDFVARLLKTAFVVFRVKDGQKKPRCMKINANGKLCFFKKFEDREIAFPIGKPYIVLDLLELKDCFPCEDKTTFVMEFKQKTYLFSSQIALDTNYLVEGFQNLIQRLKENKDYIKVFLARFKNSTTPSHKESKTLVKQIDLDFQDDDSEDFDDEINEEFTTASEDVSNTQDTAYSWSARKGEGKIARIK